MSRVVETKVRIGVEASGGEQARATIGNVAEGAKAAQQAFIGLEQEQANAYAGIASATQDTENQVQSLTNAVAKLRGELGTLPEALRATVDAMLNSLQKGDLQGAAQIRPQLAAAPPEIQRTLDTVTMQAFELSKTAPFALPRALAPAPDTGGTVPPTTPPVVATGGLEAPEPIGTTSRTPERETEKPLTLLRSAYTALKENDLETARTYGTRAARAALVEEDKGAFSVAAELPGAFREAAERDNGLESKRRYEKTLTRLETRLKDLERPPEADERTTPALGGQSALGRAARTLSGVDATLEGGVRRPSELNDVAARLGKAGAYLQQAERGGAPDRALDELREQLRELTETLEATRKTYTERPPGGSDGGPPGPQPPGGDGPDMGEIVGRYLTRMGGGGVLGGLLGKVVPGGAAVGGAVAAFGIADRMVSGANREARDTIAGQADLARQYGLESDPWELFRNSNSGFTDRDLVSMGYRGDDAERVMAQLDRPGAPGAVVEDTKDILSFSRATGLNEDRVTDAVRTMSQAGTYKVGGAETPLETLKMALTEGVRNGVSQAETMQALVNLSQQALAEGRRLSPQSLAFQASMQKTLADTGNETLKGDPGADLQTKLNSLVTGEGDVPLQMVLAPAVEGVTPEQLGLEGPAAEAFTELQRNDPAAANMDTLNLLRDGRNPALSAEVAAYFEQVMGGNSSLMNAFMESYGITGEQKYAVLGEGVGNLFTDAARGTPAMQRGEDVTTDPQAANDLARQSAAIPALRDDLESANSRANLEATGQGEENLLNLRYGVRQGVNRLKMGAGLSGADDEPAVGTAPGTIEAQPPQPPRTRKRTLDPKIYLPFSHDDEKDETPKLEPERPEPMPPTRRDMGDKVGAASYGVMAGGLEATSGADSNTRTGAFGWSQIMPENLLGRGHAGHDDMLVSGWDQAFARTAEGRPWRRELMRAGLNAMDPIPDDVALRGAMGDPNALPEWYGGLNKKQQGTIDGLMQSMTQHQLSSYYDLAREDGAKPKEATKRTLAGWYGGPAWLDRDDPERALSRDNPNFTRGHGAEGREPSIERYIDKALKTGAFNFLEQGGANASSPSEMRVTVVHQGLGDISVRGLDGKTAELFRQKLQAATTVLGENLTSVRDPKSHHGFG